MGSSEVWSGRPEPAVDVRAVADERGAAAQREERREGRRDDDVEVEEEHRVVALEAVGRELHVVEVPPEERVRACVETNHWFGGSPPNFRTLYLNQIEVDSADFWTDRLLSSSSRITAKEPGPNCSITRTLKSG